MAMHPRKVCPQCKAAVPVRLKTYERCDHVFRKAECNLLEKALESDSMKLRKTKNKWHKTSERASETREQILHRQEQKRMRMGSMKASECEQTLQRKG